MPENSIGLALSGGGLRSATYCLGVLQALASTRMLPRVDFLSPVSGGGYMAGFLGRLYSRLAADTPHKAERIEAIINDPNSAEIWWLRRHADYLAGAGRSDVETTLAVFARNLATVLFCIGALFLAGLAVLRWIADWAFPGAAAWEIAGIPVSPWWRAPAAVLLLAALPLAIGYWLTPSSRSRWPYSIFGVAGLAGAARQRHRRHRHNRSQDLGPDRDPGARAGLALAGRRAPRRASGHALRALHHALSTIGWPARWAASCCCLPQRWPSSSSIRLPASRPPCRRSHHGRFGADCIAIPAVHPRPRRFPDPWTASPRRRKWPASAPAGSRSTFWHSRSPPCCSSPST